MVRTALALLVLAGCPSSDLDAPVVRTLVGPAAAQPVRRIVALRPSCGTFGTRIGGRRPDGSLDVVDAECTAETLDGVAQHVRGQFDFLGYQVIDAERVNAVTAARHEVILHEQHTTDLTEATGATFEDATPREQTALLHELGADALLSTRVWIGAPIGLSTHRDVVVQLRLTSAADHRLIWARRCELQVGGLLATDTLAIDRAARCAAAEVPHP